MVDLWSQREFALMRETVDENNAVNDKLLHDDKTYEIEGKGYHWTQTQEEIEISFPSFSLTIAEVKSLAKVDIKSSHLKVTVKKEVVFDDDLWERVRVEESSWLVVDGVLVIQLSKVPLHPLERNNWPRCGKSEPHKHEKQYQAKLERVDVRRETEKQAPLALEHGYVYASPVANTKANILLGPGHADMEDIEMPELEDYIPISKNVVDEDAESVASSSSSSSADNGPDVKPMSKSGLGKRGISTGTFAELQRRKSEHLRKENERWRQGTPSETWDARENRPRGLGPMPLAEAIRRGEIAVDPVSSAP